MFIDTHAHIYTDAFQNEYAEIVDRAKSANVNQILMPKQMAAKPEAPEQGAKLYAELAEVNFIHR